MYLVGEKREHRVSNKVYYKLNKRELFAGLSESRQNDLDKSRADIIN